MLKRPFRHEFQPVWLIANDPEISIVCKGGDHPHLFCQRSNIGCFGHAKSQIQIAAIRLKKRKLLTADERGLTLINFRHESGWLNGEFCSVGNGLFDFIFALASDLYYSFAQRWQDSEDWQPTPTSLGLACGAKGLKALSKPEASFSLRCLSREAKSGLVVVDSFEKCAYTTNTERRSEHRNNNIWAS